MNQRKLLEIQTARGAKTAGGYITDTKSIETVITDCRKQIENKSDSYRELAPDKKRDTIKRIIIDYIMDTKPLVTGYIDGEGCPDTLKLNDKLVDEITNYGILTAAILDQTVYEVRCNGKEIKIERQGKIMDLTDKEGNIVSFDTPEQQEIVMHKLLGDVRLTPKDALVSAVTLEGYRIAAVHSSALSPDPVNPTGAKYHAFVLRKFNKTRLTLADIVGKGTMSDNMARTLTLCTAGGLTYFICGPTASGKTVTAGATLQTVPPTTRTVLIQNPSEIDLRFRDESGRIYNDVLHLEAREIDKPTASDPTVENDIDQTLRLSPTFVVLGEIRSDIQFKECVKLALAGHPLTGTYHSKTASEAISRFLTAYLAEAGNQPSHLALKTLTDTIDIIVIQKIMRDGTRKVIQISEVIGVNPDNQNEAVINDLYVFNTDGEPEYDSLGNVKSIPGKHQRVGKISNKLIRKFQLEGVARGRYDFLLQDPSSTEVETYTGDNIYHYGIKLGTDD